MKKRLLSALLALCLALSLLPGTARAEEVAFGTCGGDREWWQDNGDNLTWTLDDEGTLTIQGTGRMNTYDAVRNKFSPWTPYRGDIRTVVIEEGVTSIGAFAFWNCNLTSVVIPDSVASIGSYAFASCCNLTGVSIPDKVKTVSERVFFDCPSLTSVTIPDSVIKIEEYAFANCTSLTSVSVPDGVTEIEACAFADCTSLTSVTIPGSVTLMGRRVFSNCTSLTSVVVPCSPSESAFANCTGLTSVTVLGTAYNIGYDAFQNCTSLASITIPKDAGIDPSAFEGCNNLADVYYSGSETDWKTRWGQSGVPDGLKNAQIHYDSPLMYPVKDHTANLWTNDSLTCSLMFASEVEPGPGKAYLKRYSTDEILSTADAAEDLGNNKRLLTFTFTSDKDHPIPRGESLYITVEPDAVMIKDGSTFGGFSKKTWVFTTQFGLTAFQDRVSFLNTDVTHFFADYSKADSSYPISSAALRKRLEIFIGRNELIKQSAKTDTWGGACFGISMVTALYKTGILDVSKFDSSAQNLYEMKKPADSVQDNGVRDLVNYYYLLQFAYDYGINGGDTLTAWLFRNRGLFRDQLEKIVNAGLLSDKTKRVYVLNFGWVEIRASGMFHQHSVVLCSARQNDDGSYELLIKDPNTSALTTMQVASDFSSMTYNGHKVVAVKTIDVATMPKNLLITRPLSASLVPGARSVSANTSDTLNVTAYGGFTVTNGLGETLTFSGDGFGGTMEVFEEDFTASGDGDCAEFVFKVAPSDSYTFTSEDARSSFTVNDGANYICVEAANASGIKVRKGSSISVRGEDLDYRVYTTTATGNSFFAVSGQAEGYLNITLEPDGSGAIEADTLEGAVVKSLYDDVSWTVSDGGSSVSFAETDGDGFSLSDARLYDITLKSDPERGGAVTAASGTARAGEEVAVTAAAGSGYITDGVTVTDSAGSSLPVTASGGVYTFTMPEDRVTVTGRFVTPGQRFSDLKDGEWYRNFIAWAVENGLMQGVGGGRFDPGGKTTRGTIVTILYRLEGEPAVAGSTGYHDVAAGAWYFKAVAWAQANNIVRGTGDGRFDPDGLISREQFATILYRYAQYKGCDVSGSVGLTGYTDVSAISGWALTAMRWANAKGLITGRTTATLAPGGTADRAEAATILTRFCQDIAQP